MSNPSVSVIVPVFNCERYLAAALESIFEQGYSPLEVVVVDDGSTDSSARVAESFPVTLVRVPHGGIARARNAGVQAASGKLITFLDADDLFTPGSLAQTVDHLQERDLDAVSGMMEFFREPGVGKPPGYRSAWEAAPQHALLGGMVTRRQVFELVGEFDPTYEVGEDMDWIARFKDAHLRWERVPQVVVRYRHHMSNTTRRRELIGPNLIRLLKASVERQRHAQPLVSVVIPARDAERYIGESIDSVLAQRCSVEVIVIDDGSVDSTREVVGAYEQNHPVRCVSQEPAGAGVARNRGVELARGQYLAFLDSDDLWEPSKLALQLDAITASPEPDIVFGGVREFISPELSEAERKGLRDDSALRPGTVPGAMLIKRTTFERVGGYDATLRVGEALDWLGRARAQGLSERVLPEHVLSRRLHATNYMRQNSELVGAYPALLKAALDRRRAQGNV
jgi:glycosyltransferase involved in cell wall biosynthesis